MRGLFILQLLVFGLIGYANCWYYGQELNVCEAVGDRRKVVYSKILMKGYDGSTRLEWLPKRQLLKYTKRDCCPGWGSYLKNYGCWEKLKCPVSLPQTASLECKADRLKQLENERIFYKFKETKSPNDPNIGDNELTTPLLDQTREAVLGKAVLDEVESHWYNYYAGFLLPAIGSINADANIQFPLEQFTDYSSFLQVLNFYVERIKNIPDPKIFWYRQDPSKVLDIFSNDKWMEDKYFTMKRLAYSSSNMKRVNMYGDQANNFFKLKAQLNPWFDWDAAIKKVTGMNFYMSVFYGLVYVVDHTILNGIPFVPDLTDRDPNDDRTLRGPATPIAIFAVGNDAHRKCELKVVAIQRDKPSASQVLTPNDGNRWMVMKMEFEVSDVMIQQVGYHLTEHHFTMERICISMHRHFPTLHPLRQMVERHCVGTNGLNSNGMVGIFGEQRFAHGLFGIGHHGNIKLSNRVFANLKWKDLDFIERMKKSGTLDRELFPYHPYRDDGSLIYGVVKSAANDYIDVYYKTDVTVSSDTELQSFANELSLQGTNGPDAGKGKFDGFPNTVPTKAILKGILTQILWTVAEHSEAGYSMTEFSTFTPFSPTKVYKDAGQVLTPLQSLPDSHVATLQATFVTSVTGLHYDVLFDYGKFILDKKGRDVIDRYHTHLMTITKPIIEKRNVERLAKQQFSYPYFLPGFMPNSISI